MTASRMIDASRTALLAMCCPALLTAAALACLCAPARGATFKVLYSFAGGTDGAAPVGDLLLDGKGHLYGATSSGGDHDNGTIFELIDGKESVLYRFKGMPDGSTPSGGLIMDSAGNLYGVTTGGGKVGCGAVYKLAPGGKETVLYSFCSNGEGDGSEPTGSLLMDDAGNLVGTTRIGGAVGSGTVFQVDASGNETILYSFCSKGGIRCTDGEVPEGGLTISPSGVLYGATEINLGPEGTGGGGIYRLTPAGKQSVLHLFCSSTDCADGEEPNGQLLLAHDILYGTTLSGGANVVCQPSGQNATGCGTVMSVRLDQKNEEAVLYNFCSEADCADGSAPSPKLAIDSKGNLFGTTNTGGDPSCKGGEYPGCGVVFLLHPSGKLTVLHAFTGIAPDGTLPSSGVDLDSHGNLYGTTTSGGTGGNGIVYEILR
jgi:uncharacterized repeat protein (TIGR03803 family)